jgi:uncharacterized protein YciI
LFVFFLQENIPLEEVFENLRCSREGLTTQQAQQRLEIFGPNKLEEKEVCFVPYLLFQKKMHLRCLKMLKSWDFDGGTGRRASSSSFWGSCGIHSHGSWKLQLSWPLRWRMEG